MGTTGGKSTVTKFDAGAGKRPVVRVYPKAYELFQLWAKMGGDRNREFTCIGRATRDAEGNVTVTDAYMVKHHGSSAAVEADDDDIIQLMMRLNDHGIDGPLVDTKTPVGPEDLRCWVHSHPGRGEKATFWSGTDDACINRFLTGEFLVSIVFDSEGNHPKCRIDIPVPRVQFTADVEKMVVPALTDDDVKLAKDLFNEKSSATYAQGKGKGGGTVIRYGGYIDYDDDFEYIGYGRGCGPISSHTSHTGRGRTTVVSRGTSSSSKGGSSKADTTFRKHIAEAFGLDPHEVDPRYIEWAQDNGDRFGEWSFGVDETGLDTDEMTAEQIAQVEDAEEQIALAYDYEMTDSEKLKFDIASATGELTEEQLAELEARHAHAELSDIDEELVERMELRALEEAAVEVAIEVAGGGMERVDAAAYLSATHGVSASVADAALAQHLE
jgi:hypothetical protein